VGVGLGTTNTPDDMRGTSLEMLKHMVSLGNHHTLIPKLAHHQWSLTDSGLNTREFSNPIPSRSIGLVFRKNSPRTQLFLALKKIIIDKLPQDLTQNSNDIEILKFN
jgi:hypothetical protein